MENCLANWPLVLEYLKVLLSWPPIVLLLALLFAKRLQTPVVDLLARVRKWKSFGVEAELADQQVVAAKMPAAEAEDLLTHNSSDPVRARAEILRIWQLFNFERWFNVIYGSQIRLLEHLRLLGAVGAPVAELDPFYDEHLSLAKEHAAAKDNFLGFLKHTGVIEFFADGDTTKVRISNLGNMFLTHIRQSYGSSARAF